MVGSLAINLCGDKYGRLTVLSRADNSGRGRVQWVCRCACGNIAVVMSCNLRSGHTQSCGCLIDKSRRAKATHGHTVGGIYSAEFNTWQRILTRCYNENEKSYPNYGGRGIRVCPQWFKFENFYADMGRRPSKDYSIDRYPNNDGDYEPSNCRWATRSEQCRNRRSSRIIIHNGKRMTLAEASETSGIPYHTLKQRLGKLGWTVNRSMTEPVNG